MTGWSALIDHEQKAVLIAIEAHLDQFLCVAGSVSLAPERTARPRPVDYSSLFQRFGNALRVHPCEHQDFSGVMLLGDGRD